MLKYIVRSAKTNAAKEPEEEPEPDSEPEILGPISIRPVLKATRPSLEADHKILGPFNERSKKQATYDVRFIEDLVHGSKRFQYLKDETVLRLIAKRRTYRYLKKFAVGRLKRKLENKFSIFKELLTCDSNTGNLNDELVNNIFSWSLQDFLARRDLKDFVWVDVLLRADEACLHIYKFKQDLLQLQQHVEKIFEVLCANIENEDFDLYRNVEKPIFEAQQLLKTINSIENELKRNIHGLKEIQEKDFILSTAKRNSEEQFLKNYLENRLWNSHIWDPIETRYSLTWYHNIVDQNRYAFDCMLEKQKREIDNYNDRMFDETCVDDNCMDFFYAETEVYKTRITAMQEKLDKDTETMDTKLILKRIQIDKLLDQQKSLNDEIERFHKEEEQMRERLAKEEMEAEMKRIEEQEMEALRLEKEAAKAKKKGAKPGAKPGDKPGAKPADKPAAKPPAKKAGKKGK